MNEVFAILLPMGDDLPLIPTLLFVAAFGSVIGSFLNVVVYRWPIGKSLVRPSSRCPKCETPIRPRDNVPVLSWLLLRGRCRACGAAISARYPLVELTVAIVFGLFALLEPLKEGVNLPVPPPATPHEMIAASPSAEELWGECAFHLLLACGLLCIALIESDGEPTPGRLIWPLVALTLAAPAIWPWLHPVPATLAIPSDHPARGLFDSVAGGFVGVVMGCLASPLSKLSASGAAGPRTTIRALAVVGAGLGWQAVAVIAVAATLLDALAVLYRNAWHGFQRVPYTGCLFVATVVWILFWRKVTSFDDRLGFNSDYWLLAASGVSVLLVAAVGWRFRGRPIDG